MPTTVREEILNLRKRVKILEKKIENLEKETTSTSSSQSPGSYKSLGENINLPQRSTCQVSVQEILSKNQGIF